MSDYTFVAGSFPKIVTTTRPRRKNEAAINDPFIREYIKLLAELLLIKKELKNIKIGYIGGYEKEENNNTAKLYYSALTYFFKELGYGELAKENFVIFNKEDYLEDKNKVNENLQKLDFLFLGLGDDSKFGNFLDILYKDGIDLKEYIKNNNILVTGVCAGSVVTSNNIYGGKYDSFYHDRPIFQYPENYPALNINKVTMETNLFPESQTEEKNNQFKLECLLPDSYEVGFFGCKPNSLIIMNFDKVYALGEIYLYIDGKDILVSNDNIVDISKLNELVNKYNINKILNTKKEIEEEIEKLKEKSDFEDFKEEFKRCEIQKETNSKIRKEILNTYLFNSLSEIERTSREIKPDKFNKNFLNALNLETDSLKEIYIKYNLLGIIKQASKEYKNLSTFFFDDLYDFFKEYVSINPTLTLYFIECFSSFYTNKKVKDLLALCKNETTKKVNILSTNNMYFKRLIKIASC